MAQFNKNTQDFLNQERTLFEVNMIANKDGEVVEETNRFPVDSVILTGIGTSAVTTTNPFAVQVTQSNEIVSQVNPFYITAAPSATAAFGEILVAEVTPVVQADAIYGVSQDLKDQFQIYTAFGGTAGVGTTASGQFNMFGVQSSSTQYSYGVIRTKRFARYRPGQGVVGRFTAQFTASGPTGVGSTYIGLPGTQQRAGLFNQEDALQIGYNGTDFSILLARQGKAHIHKLTITAGPAASTNATIIVNGVSYTIPLVSGETTAQTAARISRFTFTGWLVEHIDNTVTFLSTSASPQEGTYSFSHATATATFALVRAGVSPQDIWIPQDQWNGDQMTGIGGPTNPTSIRLDPSKLNVYQIQMKWLGAGIIRFSVEDPRESGYGSMIVLHTIHWSNKYTSTHIGNPSMKMGLVAYNLVGPTGIVTVSSGSWMMGIEGKITQNDYPRSAPANKSNLSANTLHHLISIENPIVRGNVLNAKEVNPQDFSVATKSGGTTAPVEVLLFLDATPQSGTHIFKSLPESAISICTDALTFSDTVNTPIISFTVAPSGNQQFDLRPYRAIIPPGSKLSIAVRSTQVIDNITAAIVWIAD